MSAPKKDLLLAELVRQENIIRNLERQRDDARARIESLREQIEIAEREPAQLALEPPAPANPPPVARTSESPPAPYLDTKLRLFRQLFRGREDVYPRYWEKPAEDKKGYSPGTSSCSRTAGRERSRRRATRG